MFAPTWWSRALILGPAFAAYYVYCAWASHQQYPWLWWSIAPLAGYALVQFLWWSGVRELRRQGYLSRPGEGAGELGEDRQIGMEPNALDASDSQRQ